MSPIVNPHPKGCFWHDAAEKFGPPDIKYCEETICSFISEPANTWSNLSFIIVAFFIIYFRKSESSFRFLKLYGLNTFFVGFTSFIYHLSNNFLTQFIDFLGMYAFFGLLLLGNLELLGTIKNEKVTKTYLVSFVPFSLVFLSFRGLQIPVQLSIFVVILGCLVSKFYVLKVYKINIQKLLVVLAFFVIAFACQVSDIMRLFCDPKNHFFQFHALWHVFNAIGMYALYEYYGALLENKRE